MRWALSCARERQSEPILIALVIPALTNSSFCHYLDFPEVCWVGDFKWGAPTLLPAGYWTAPSPTSELPAVPAANAHSIHLIGNELGHATYRPKDLYEKLTLAYSKLHYAAALKNHTCDMLSWNPRCLDYHAADFQEIRVLQKRRFTMIEREELLQCKPPRKASRAVRTLPQPDHRYQDLLSRASAKSRAERLAAHYSEPVTTKFDWKQHAYYSDGSLTQLETEIGRAHV